MVIPSAGLAQIEDCRATLDANSRPAVEGQTNGVQLEGGEPLARSVFMQQACQPGLAGTKLTPFLCLGDLLAHYGRIAASRKAILSVGGPSLTYAALWRSAESAIRALRSNGVGRTDRVAVVLPSGPEAAAAVVLVAAAAVCVPLNPGFITDEWQRYLTELRIAALVTSADMDSASRGVAHTLGIPVINLSRLREEAGRFSVGGREPQFKNDEGFACAGDDAFILLTSGTGSRPKMVPLAQASVCLSAYNVGAALGLRSRDRLLNVLSLYHAHGLISGLLASLAAGSSVVCTTRFDSAAFFVWLKECRPTWYTAVPAIHQAVLSAAQEHPQGVRPSSLRLVRSASSHLSPEVLGQLESLFGVPVIDTYGMTEAASQIAANPLDKRKPGSVGRSAGAEIAILDDEGRNLSTGERGEIALRGPTLTRGYDNDAAATQAAFRDGWFRTGDLGYLDDDGYLFIVGRVKDLINRGGEKIAPAEVEQVLLQHPSVVEAAVFSISHRRLGEDVAAAVVVRQGKVSARKLRDFALERLARFKVPGLIRIVREIPKTPNGKIRRAGLAATLGIEGERAPAGRRDKREPRSALERELAETWAGLLGLKQIDIEDDIHALGADSLTATRMISRLRARFGVNLSIKDLFDAPTVATLAARLEAQRIPAAMPLSLGSTSDDIGPAHLSFQQQRMYLLSQLDPTGYNYNVLDMARLVGRVNVGALEAAIATICERHEVLRSTFVEHAGEPMQVVGAAAPPRLTIVDIGEHAKRRGSKAIQRHARAWWRRAFQLDTAPPLQVQLLRLGENDHVLMVKVHHLVTDGWSQRLFWEELEALYNASPNDVANRLPKLPVQYRHFAQWQLAWLKTPAAEEQRRHWSAHLAGVTELPLRTDRPRPEMRTGRGARCPLHLSRALTRKIKSLSASHGVTLFMSLLAAFQCLLYRYTKHDDVVVGSLIANRTHAEIERVVGMFANTIILRTDLSGDPSFAELLLRVRHVTFEAYRNQDLPIEEILQALHPSRSMDRNVLFQVMFLLQNASARAPRLRELSVKFLEVDPGIARFDLMLELVEADERLTGWLEYTTDLFEAETIARMAAHFRTLLEAIVANCEQPISKLSLLPAQERKRVLVDFNNTRVDFCHLGTFCERFADQAQRAPDAIAVSAGQVRLSYRDLAGRSSSIAERLVKERVGPEVVVVLAANRSVDLLAAMIATQQVGGAFLSLDPTLPLARLAQIVRHSSAPLVAAGRAYVATLDQALCSIPALERPQVLTLEELAQGGRCDLPGPIIRSTPASLGYVIYTSGSTGVPKGAMIEQRGLLNHLYVMASDLGLSASDVIAQTAPQSFDISVWQFLTGLMVGGRVHICAEDQVRDPALLTREIAREGVTILQIVPALLRAIVDRAANESCFSTLGRLRWLICTGEAPTPDLCRSWLRLFPNVPMVNAYGPAECSDDVALHRIVAPAPAWLANVPIGRPIANTRLYVLDTHLQPVPIGVSGELCVAGTAVGRGYLNDPEQTRRSFLRDPFSKRRGGRLYRTGDMARWLPDGTLEFLGRVDHQVKVRGYRVELDEIEHILVEHPDIESAAVLLQRLGSQPRLVAYLVLSGAREPSIEGICDFLKTRLPTYMIPAGFTFLACMPLMAHGKVDRAALAAIPEGLKVAARQFVAPRSAVEESVAGIWAELLGLAEVGVFDNFFDLGGHSLLAGQVLARLVTLFRVSLSLRTFFEEPTVAALAGCVEEARGMQSDESTLEISHGEGSPPVSIVQEHVLRIERELPGLPQFNLPFAYRLRGPLNVIALEQSLAEVVRRHESLRTGFVWVGERPIARVRPAAAIQPSLVVENLACSRATSGPRAKALLVKKAELQAELEAWTPFELDRAPLLRFRLLRLGPDDHVLLLVLHHIIVDGWSIGLFLEEVSDLYAASAAGDEARLPGPELQFADFARWQRVWSNTADAARQFAYWKEHLRSVSPVFSTGRDVERALLNSPIVHEPIHVPDALVARLTALGRRQGGTLFMTLLAGFKTLLLARSGCKDICVATAMANRAQPQVHRVIGPLENTALIRTRIDADLSFQEALRRVREAVLKAYAQQSLPFDVLSAQLAEDSQFDPASTIQVFFVVQNAYRRLLKLPGVAVGSFGKIFREGQPVLPIDRTWLTVMLKETPSGITGSCTSKSELIAPDALQHLVAEYTRILAKAAEDPEARLGRLADDCLGGVDSDDSAGFGVRARVR